MPLADVRACQHCQVLKPESHSDSNSQTNAIPQWLDGLGGPPAENTLPRGAAPGLSLLLLLSPQPLFS